MKSTAAEAPAAPAPTPPAAEAEEKPRVIVESGGRRFGKPSGLSFGKREENQEERPAAEERRAEPPPVRQREEPPAQPRNNDRGFGERPQPKRIEVNEGGQRPEQKQGRPEQQQRSENRPQENRPQEKRRDEGQHQRHESRQENRREESRREDRSRPPQGQNQQSREARPAPAARPREVSGPKRAEGEPGRLCGWLVSYVDPHGAAIELREGKFFVSRSSLKPSDLIIEEDSISTPHALVTVVGGNPLHIQDLMSERGVFTRKRGADAYQRIDENVEVEHGDWVRFGDVEFLVSMIAHVGALGE